MEIQKSNNKKTMAHLGTWVRSASEIVRFPNPIVSWEPDYLKVKWLFSELPSWFHPLHCSLQSFSNTSKGPKNRDIVSLQKSKLTNLWSKNVM